MNIGSSASVLVRDACRNSGNASPPRRASVLAAEVETNVRAFPLTIAIRDLLSRQNGVPAAQGTAGLASFHVAFFPVVPFCARVQRRTDAFPHNVGINRVGQRSDF